MELRATKTHLEAKIIRYRRRANLFKAVLQCSLVFMLSILFYDRFKRRIPNDQHTTSQVDSILEEHAVNSVLLIEALNSTVFLSKGKTLKAKMDTLSQVDQNSPIKVQGIEGNVPVSDTEYVRFTIGKAFVNAKTQRWMIPSLSFSISEVFYGVSHKGAFDLKTLTYTSRGGTEFSGTNFNGKANCSTLNLRQQTLTFSKGFEIVFH